MAKLTVDISGMKRIYMEAQNSIFLAMFDDFDELERECNINKIDLELDSEEDE